MEKRHKPDKTISGEAIAFYPAFSFAAPDSDFRMAEKTLAFDPFSQDRQQRCQESGLLVVHVSKALFTTNPSRLNPN